MSKSGSASNAATSSVSLGYTAINPELENNRSSLSSGTEPRNVKLFTGWVWPQNRGDRQSFDSRTPIGCQGSEGHIAGWYLVYDYADNRPTVRNIQKTRISSDPGTVNNVRVLHGGSKRYARMQSIRDGIEHPHEEPHRVAT